MRLLGGWGAGVVGWVGVIWWNLEGRGSLVTGDLCSVGVVGRLGRRRLGE